MSTLPGSNRPILRGAAAVGIVALLVRLGAVFSAGLYFPPAADGFYYHRLAERVAAGAGYTWLWPDGVVTPAAHYPVGYPALLAVFYALFGPRPGAAMLFNAAVGTCAAIAVYGLATHATSRRAAWIAGMAVALHPGLVAYTPALMTEGITAALLACAAWAAAWARQALALDGLRTGQAWVRLAVMGLLVGLATLVRPQSLVVAPLLALVASSDPDRRGWVRRGLVAAGLTTGIAICVCLPWTIRNCAQMGRCALVSVNGGWNLLIGADPASKGTWSPINVPEACREVFDEAEKNACFGRQAAGYIAAHPASWVSKIPLKLAATFNYCDAAGWYLNEANPKVCTSRCKLWLGIAETVYERAVLLSGLLWVGWGWARSNLRKSFWHSIDTRIRNMRASTVVATLGIPFVFMTHAWVGYLALALAGVLLGRDLLRGPLLFSAALVVLISTMATHAVFFGAGRYALVVFPLLTGVGILGAGCKRSDGPEL